MAKSKRKRVPKTMLKLPDLEQSKSAVLNSLPLASSKRSYDHAIRESSTGNARSLASRLTRPWSHRTGSHSNSPHTPRRRLT